MSNPPRFTLELRLIDYYDPGNDLRISEPVDDAVRISARVVDDIKVGNDDGVGLVGFDDVVRVMRQREFRKELFISEARRMGALLAERMEDAEGWHGSSRVEPAREQLGGKWR